MKISMLVAFTLNAMISPPDTVTLDKCIDSALHHHPSTKQLALTGEVAEKEKAKLGTNFKPRLSIQGRATYQSEVVDLPVENPMIKIPELPHDHYRGYAEISQLLYDGGANQSQKRLTEIRRDIDRKKVKKTHHALKNQVISLYFSKLLSEKSKATLDTTLAYLQAKVKSLKSAQRHGVATNKDLLLLKSHVEELHQQKEKLAYRELAAVQAMSQLSKMDMDSLTAFKIPEFPGTGEKTQIRRPALQQLSLQQKELNERQELASAQRRPKLSFFAQGGGGYPNPYNIFDNEFSPFYLLGINFSWSLWEWGKVDKQKEILRLRTQKLEQQKAAFKENVKTQLTKQQAEIEGLKQQVKRAHKILEMKKEVRKISSNQLDKGIITTTDYLDAVSEAAQARLNLEKNRIELAMAKREYRHLAGK